MEIVALSPVHATTLTWRRDAKTWALTVVVKATFDLVPAEMRLSQTQDPLLDQDRRWEEEPGRSLHSPSDLVPFKARADVMLVGHAYAPNGKSVRSLLARLVVGGVDKSIAVLGDRATQGREPAPFTIMALRYERAAGGLGQPNPSGIAASEARLPNLEPAIRAGRDGARQADDGAPIAGFGPIAPDWPQRRGRLQGGASTWAPNDPLDESDPLFFNAAPADQQLAALRDDQPLLLENLHPDHARLSTRLPGLRPQAFVERPHAAPHELEMRADALWIDTDRGRCTVTWRGHFPLAQRDEPGRVFVAMTGARQQLAWDDIKGLERAIGADQSPPAPRKIPNLEAFDHDDDDGDDTMTIARKLPMPALPPRRVPAPKPTLVGTPPPPAPIAVALPPTTPPPAMPASAAPPPLPPPLSPERLRALLASRDLSPGFDLAEPTSTDFYTVGEHTPILDASPAWLALHSVPTPAVPSVTPTAIVPAPTPSAPPVVAAPPIVVAQPPPQMAPLAAALPSAVATLTGDARSPWAAASATPRPTAPPAPAPPPSKPVAPSKAPSRTATLTGSSKPPADVLDLLWFDPDALPRIRARFSALIDELEFEALDPRHDLPVDDPKASRDRHHAFGVLTQAPMTDAAGVSRAMLDAISDRGRFTPPVVVLSGELRFPFDEVEHLKAAAAAAKPLAKDDKRLGDLIDTVNELAGTLLLQGSPGAIDSLLKDLSSAVSQSKRPLPVKFLDAHLERVLLEQRRYQKRTVFGAPMLRGLFTPTGSSAALPAYLPESVADKLPLVVQMKVRLIAEASSSQDQYESHPQALRVVALGRAMAVDGWRR
jgi:hypothetical protein